jgi:hypothetical protein
MNLMASPTVTIDRPRHPNFDPELLLEGHDQFDGVQAVGAES